MTFSPTLFDPNDLRTAPPRYRDALLSPKVGDAGVRMLNRVDHRGLEVWDIWDMRPHIEDRRVLPVCKAMGVEGEEDAKRCAEDVYSNRVVVVVAGKRGALIRPRRVGRLLE